MKALSVEQVTAMRSWVADTAEALSTIGGKLTADDVRGLSDDEIVAAVQRHYGGGVELFLIHLNLYGGPIR